MNGLIAGAALLAVPLVICALGGLVHRASGLVNIGLEGQMLAGALLGAVVSGYTRSWVLGVLAAAAIGMFASYLLTVCVTRLGANEIIAGLGMNIVITGLIGFVLKWKLGVSSTLRVENLEGLPQLPLPGISEVPILGPLISDRDPLFWLAVLLLPLTAWLLRATRFGLRLRAAGDAESAAESLGLNVRRLREGAGAIAGALAGVAGAHLSLGQVGLFNTQMVAGRGFIALAAFYFGRNKPIPTVAACLVFALFDALQVRLQSGSSSGQLVSTIPYLVVVVILTLSALRERRGRVTV
jgi:simple sugar transport system permease protein